jgi:hypothetical protein
MIASITRQFIESMTDFFKPLQELHETLTSRGQRNPSLKDLEHLLISVCDTYDASYVVFDALDECSSDQRKLLLPVFRLLQKSGVKIFVTSRCHAQDLERAFSDQSRIDIRATESDLRDYAENQLEDDENLMDLLPDDLRSNIVTTIASKANGM